MDAQPIIITDLFWNSVGKKYAKAHTPIKTMYVTLVKMLSET